MSDTRTHIRREDGTYERTEFYYDKMMTKLCGPNWRANRPTKPGKKKEVLTLLKTRTKLTRFLTGSVEDLLAFKAEACYIILQNNKEIIISDDALLVQLTFGEVEELPNTTVESVVELEQPDFLWLQIGTTRNNFVGHQIMRLIQKRIELGKMTFVVQAGRPDKDTWKAYYKFSGFVEFLEGLIKPDGGGYSVHGFK